MNSDSNNMCDRCNSINSIITDYVYGEVVCNNCGKVYEERLIVDEYEDRTFQDNSNKIQHVDAPINPIYENEVGTKLIIRENGKTRCVNNYSKKSSIGRNFYKIQKLLSSQNIPCGFRAFPTSSSSPTSPSAKSWNAAPRAPMTRQRPHCRFSTRTRRYCAMSASRILPSFRAREAR